MCAVDSEGDVGSVGNSLTVGSSEQEHMATKPIEIRELSHWTWSSGLQYKCLHSDKGQTDKNQQVVQLVKYSRS